ncbi:MAG TPA: hypothetical protein VIW48_00340 [Nitrospiraceae bacterium]
MGANLPRVRTMRNWSTIPMVSPNRHDTVLGPGKDNVKQFQDQADAIPQRIYPIFFSNDGPDNVASSWSVHPVPRHSSGVRWITCPTIHTRASASRPRPLQEILLAWKSGPRQSAAVRAFQRKLLQFRFRRDALSPIH